MPPIHVLGTEPGCEGGAIEATRPREDLRQTAPTTLEDVADEPLVAGPVIDERSRAARDPQQSSIHTRDGTEGGGRNAPEQVELEPRPPGRRHERGAADAGTPTGDLPLHEEDRVRPGPAVEDPAEDRGREVERDIADEHVRAFRQAVPHHVARDDRDTRGSAAAESLGPNVIELDGREGTAESRERHGERAVSGADLENRGG